MHRKALLAAAFAALTGSVAVAQINGTPIDSGSVIPAAETTCNASRVVRTTSTVYVYEEACHNGTVKWWTDMIVVTTCDFVITTTFSVASFGLRANDSFKFNVYVEHLAGPYNGRYTWDLLQTSVAVADRVARREEIAAA